MQNQEKESAQAEEQDIVLPDWFAHLHSLHQVYYRAMVNLGPDGRHNEEAVLTELKRLGVAWTKDQLGLHARTFVNSRALAKLKSEKGV